MLSISLLNKNSLFTLSEIISRVIGWGFIFTAAFFLSVEDYGLLSLLMAVEAIVVVVFLSGFERAAMRFVSDASENVSAKDILISWLFVAAILAIIILVSILLFSWPDQFYLDGINSVIFILSCFLISLSRLLAAISRATLASNEFFILRVFSIIIKILLFYLIVCFLDGIVFSFLLSTSLAFLIVVILTFRSTLNVERECKDDDRKIMLYALPFLPHAISSVLLASIDRVMIEKILTVNEVGVYNLSYMLGSTLSFAYAVIAVTYEKKLFSSSSDFSMVNGLQNMYFQLLNCLGYMGLVAICIVITVMNYFTEKYNHQDFVFVAYLVMISYIINIHYLKASYYLSVSKKTGFIAVVTFIAMCVNVGLNYVLIEPMGIRGAAIATLVSYMALAFCMSIVAGSRTDYPAIDKQGATYALLSVAMLFVLVVEERYVVVVSAVIALLSLKRGLQGARFFLAR